VSQLLLGDCLEVMRTLSDCSVDAVVTDPPYGLADHPPKEVAACLAAWLAGEPYKPKGKGFMGKAWDAWVPGPEVWRECLRVLKPGGHLLAFAGTRSMDLMSMAVRLAGFELRDSIGWAHDGGGAPLLAWTYGSGFPKSLDVSKAIDRAAGAEREVVGVNPNSRPAKRKGGAGFDAAVGGEGLGDMPITAPATPEAQQWAGWGTALKPSWEPVILARKPLEGTVAANVLAHGTGGINVDGCRVQGPGAMKWETPRGGIWSTDSEATAQLVQNTQGRWPANLIHSGEDEVVGLFPQTVGKIGMVGNTGGNNRIYGKLGRQEDRQPGTTDTGSAARFFKQCKGYTKAWPNLTPEPANTAGSSFSPSRQFVAFALSDAATWALPVGSCNSLSLAPSTSATANELRQLSESVITAIQSIAPKFWQESRPAKLTLTLNHASFAVTREQTGITTITASHWKSDGSAEPVTFNITGTNTEAGDQASAPRAFYTAKASRDDRSDGNTHPTVKPTDLMRYLCRLVTPPGGIVLDPFMGSGSTGKAAMLEGFEFIGIEREAAYHAIAESRIGRAAAAGYQPSLLP
jgi:DNA modification methylase